MSSKHLLLMAWLMVFASGAARSARAQWTVDLSFDPPLQTVPFGSEVRVAINATSSGPSGQALSAIDAIVSWDPAVLLFVGHDDSLAGHDWFAAGFFSDPDGINATFADGEALFTALSQTATPAVAPPGTGLHVTSLRFITIAATPATTVTYTPSAGLFGQTRVIDYFTPGLQITGDISASATLEVAPKTAVYCTAKVNSLGCTPMIDFIGTPSATSPDPFTITGSTVLNFRNGLLFYGYLGPASAPFFGGTLCVQPPLRRTGVQNSGGTMPPAMDCSGLYSFDFNALIQSSVDPLLVPGQQINAQYWSRDPLHLDGTGVGLTDAIEFVIVD